MAQQTFKTTVVLVSSRESTEVFRSVEAVPVRVRRKILATAARGNSATILIADRRGRRELARAVQGLPSAVQVRTGARIRTRLANWIVNRSIWFDIALLGLGGALLWAAAVLH